MALQLALKPHSLRSLRRLSSSSSSSPPPPDPSAAAAESPPSSDAAAAPQPHFASYFSDIKDRLRSPPPPPRRPPIFSPPPPAAPSPSSLDDIRKHLAEFRLKPGRSPPSSPSAPPTLSFQELFKNNQLRNNNNNPSSSSSSSPPTTPSNNQGLTFDSIRESLRKFRDSQPPSTRTTAAPAFKGFNNFRDRISTTPILGKNDRLPGSIFSREAKTDENGPKTPRTEFVRIYSHEELGAKLRELRPEAAKKGGTDWFSLTELNERLAKLRELEEKEADSKMGGVCFMDLKDSLRRLQHEDTQKKINSQRLSIWNNLTGEPTPTFMLKPPQEELLEKYSHPDHMSAAEKMKLQLKKVRDEFKMSDSDCGSTRVQVAQLTTKIKHLSSVLHKKDKHSRKGLQEMVQRRKKLLKYLRRTDWDSYCFVLSKLGLRDVPEYKAPNYKA